MKRIIGAGGILLAVALVIIYLQVGPFGLPEGRGVDPGPEAAERLFEELVSALNANSADAIAELFHRPVESPDIQNILNLYGGRDLHDVQITVGHEFPFIYNVLVEAQTHDGVTIEIYQVVEWTGEHWSTGPLNIP